MKHIFFILSLLLFSSFSVFGQKYLTKIGTISFNSSTTVEKIEAVNRGAVCIIDAATGKIEFSVLMKGFIFEKALMQEHFNENYVESSKYPKATFKGNIQDVSQVNWEQDGTYNVVVAGNLTMKDRTNAVSSPGTLTIKNGKITALSTFKVKLADYNVKIPGAVKANVSETVSIKVNCELAKMLNNR